MKLVIALTILWLIVLFGVFIFVTRPVPISLPIQPKVSSPKRSVGSKVSLPYEARISDLRDGEKGHGEVFFSQAGEAFVWPWTPQRGSNFVWHVNGQWYAHLVEPIDSSQITGYQDIPDDAQAVILQ